jgi:hypothetical protein
MMKTIVLKAKCKDSTESRPLFFGMRIENRNNDWIRVWAFRINERDQASSEFDEILPVQGTFDKTTEYPGCPYCSADSFLTCPCCKKLTCIAWGSPSGQCRWCGNRTDTKEWRAKPMVTDGTDYNH